MIMIPISTQGIHHVCMKVGDVAREVDFYTSQLGYTVRFRWEGGALLKAPDGTHLEFFPEDTEKGYAHVAYACTDVDAVYAQALAAGCVSVTAPTDTALPTQPPLAIRIAFFKDPAGNVVELFCEKAE